MIKKLFTVIISILLLSSCSNRNSYYVLSFDDYSLAVGYDDVEFLKLVFTVDSQDKMQPKELRENVDVSFWNRHFAYMDIINYKNREIDIDKAIICKADIYLSNLEMETFKINGIELSDSVKQNCKILNGELIERNGYACIISKVVDDKENVAILHGDIFNADQDLLSRIEIYVK